MQDSAAIVLAAGGGERLGEPSKPKAFVDIGGRPILVWAAEAAFSSGIGSLVAVVPEGWEGFARSLLEPVGPYSVVAGGPTRQASVRAGLAAVTGDGLILCHDAARPFATRDLFLAVRSILDRFPDVDGAAPVIDVTDTVKRVREGFVVGTEEREGIVLAQTPQCFRGAALRDSHARAAEEGNGFTDDAAVLEWAGYRVKAVAGEVGNFKITTAEDLERAELAARELAHG